MKRPPGTRLARGSLAATFGLCLAGAAGIAGAREDRGFTIGFEAGMADASTLESVLSAVNHPTKCDTLLYADPGMAPSGDAACMDNTLRPLFANRFGPGSGFTGGLSVGYDFGKLRFDLEYAARQHDGETVPLLTAAGNPALAGKANEWSPVDPPTESVSDFSSRELFVNAYRDFDNGTSWTPFVGVGVGQARTKVGYGARLVRKTLAQGYQDVDPPTTLADRPAAAAGTLSQFDSEFSDTLFGYQVLAGLDHALGDNASFTIKARWAQFEELSGSDLWTLVRSHEPVRADGSTPFDSDLEFDGIGYVGVTAGLRYRF